MATWKITVKVNDNVHVGGLGTIHLEKGMSVEYVGNNSWNPLDTDSTRQIVNQLFLSKYNIDLKKYGQLTRTVLDCVKV